MELNILIGGRAGQGVLKISHTLAKAFIKTGYYVFNYRDYQSRIRGGHNYNALKISDKPVYSHEEEDIDFIIALDQNTVDIHQYKLNSRGYIITDRRIKANRKIEVDAEKILNECKAPHLSINVVLISVLWKVLGLNKNVLREVIFKELGELNAKVVDRTFDELQSPVEEIRDKKAYNKKYYLTGSEGIAYGATAAGLDIYIAYPMTPASPVLHILAKLKDKYDILVYQPDNEIGAINMAIGASYAGAKVMVGTSGGGFALMNEALSLSGMSEIPIVIYLAQRYAPATGMPTYTMQGDLKYSLNAGHGEFPRVVIAPGDPSEAFRRTIEAFYLAYKYRIPTIILSDTYLAESAVTFNEIKNTNVKPGRYIDLTPGERLYPYYKITVEGVSPRTIPGVNNTVVKANSYEHDEYGFTTENPDMGLTMNEKRWEKIKYIEEEIRGLDPYELLGAGKKLLVGWGSTKMPAMEALKHLEDWTYLHISYISPFPRALKDIFESYETIVLIENNVTGLLGQVIREQTGVNIENKILKYDGRPFTSRYIIKRLEEFNS